VKDKKKKYDVTKKLCNNAKQNKNTQKERRGGTLKH